LPSLGLAAGSRRSAAPASLAQEWLAIRVCSAHGARLRQALGPDFPLVVPGIRPEGAALGDQRRVMGPAEARDAGANIYW
jgi:orotidine-5'-phosphate decarboxylase